MFGKKKDILKIDQEQLALIEHAQQRIKQKKRLRFHLVLFLLISLFVVILNLALGIGKDYTLFGYDWFVFILLIWSFIFIYHTISVYITHKFMGKLWEQNQLQKLVNLQQQRIEQLKKNLDIEEKIIAESENFTGKKSQELTIIVAAAENDAIGKDNQLIWHLSNDLKRFKALTNGHHIIMGRKTFESFPKPLPNRTHIVITRNKEYQVPDGVIVVNSLKDAIDASKNDTNPFIIGGGNIYAQAMILADKIELTRVHHTFEGDTFFPKIDTSIWKETANTFHNKDDNHDYEFSFLTYVKA